MAADPHKVEIKAVRLRIVRRIEWVRRSLLLERLWLALWPLPILIGGYAALALWGVWDRVPPHVHVVALVILFAACLALCFYRLRSLVLPGKFDAQRRLEEDGKVRHRPLDAIFEPPLLIDGGRSLWRHHRAHMLAVADSLQARLPRMSLVFEDPRAMRSIALLGLFTGLLYAGNDSGRRLAHGFVPVFYSDLNGVALDAWITPPDYTGKSPIILEGPLGASGQSSGAALSVPQGSLINLRLNGGSQTPVLTDGERETNFTAIGEKDYHLEAAIDRGGQWRVRQGRQVVAMWPFDIVPDTPPAIGFTAPPGESRRQSLKVDYTLDDDYGVVSATLVLTPLDDGEPIEVPLRGADTREKPRTLTAYEDLTTHIYAGRNVTARLIAEDALGQTGESDSLIITLPERQFTHPVAKELAAIRKDMLIKPSQAIKLASRLDRVSRDLEAYDGDMTAFSAMRSAYWRLGSDQSQTAVFEIGDILWETALHIEDGKLSLATRSLRDALDDFEKAMEGDLSSLDRAADALQQMMQQFLSQMAQQQGSAAPISTDPLGQMQVVGADMVQEMINQMRDLAAAGDMEGAMQMMNQIRDLMENASTNTMTAEDYQRMSAMNEAAEKLENMSERQRDILNRTSRQTLLNKMREENGNPVQSFEPLGSEQTDLGDALGQVLDEMKDAGVDMPDSLGRADEAMGDASRELSNESGTGAIRGQADALRALEEAQEMLRESLDQAMAQMPSANGLDPLGRPNPGLNTRGYELPDMMDVRQVERILQELRKRIADPDLSEEERAYLRRLLRRF